ncbi:HTTM domain-containing protein [Egibacter rhizosphaerae]|nr:HTTM domain-containing protein [Egibacter rhizosphaerae]
MEAGPFRPTDLGRFRVLFCCYALLNLPSFSWVAAFPDTFHSPPPGPFALIGGFPHPTVLSFLEVGVALALVAVLIGWWTRAASIMATGFMLVGYGFSFSFGKIDHNILFVVLPVFMAYAGWGAAYSVDAARGGAYEVRQWGMRLLALAVAMAFATAALPKWRQGWLSTDTQAVRNELMQSQHTSDPGWLGHLLIGSVDSAAFWIALDWGAVLFEFGMVAAVLSWASFRLLLAIAGLFHLSVMLVFDITFAPNILVYAAFIPWASLSVPKLLASPFRKAAVRLERRPRPPLVVGAGGAVVWLASPLLRQIAVPVSASVVVIGGVVGGVYLAWRLQRLLKTGPGLEHDHLARTAGRSSVE